MNTTPQSPRSDPRSQARQPDAGAKPSKKTLAIVLGGIGVLLLAVIVAVVGFWRPEAGAEKEPVFHPAGSQSAWLDERYADPGSSWTTGDRPVGVSSDRSIMAVATYPTLSGLDLLTGEEKWHLDAVDCNVSPVVDGVAYCTTFTDAYTELLRIPLDTGVPEVYYLIPGFMVSVTPIGERDGNVIVLADLAQGARLMSIAADGSETIEWQTSVPNPDSNIDCQLLSTHIGCSDPTNSSFFVVDASTGEIALDNDLDSENDERVVWAWDGYAIVRGYSSPPSYPVFDFARNKVGQSRSYLPDAPDESDGIFYSTADMLLGITAQAVDAQGTIVVEEQDPEHAVFRPSGNALPERCKAVAVSADGSLVAVHVEFEHYEIFSRDGDRVDDFGAEAGDMRILDGIVLSWPIGGSATVFAPGS